MESKKVNGTYKLACPRCGQHKLEYVPHPQTYLEVPCRNCKSVVVVVGYAVTVRERGEKPLTRRMQ